jgi:serine/threonine protein kinase
MHNDSFSGRTTNAPFGAGSKLGPYTLVEPLGKGGMGQVWKAWDGKRHVALKLLPPEFRDNPAAIAQVDGAFQVVHTLTHQHICKTLALVDDSQYGPFLVLDYISDIAPGITLSQYQKRVGYPQQRMPLEKVVQILGPIAAALDYAHRKVFYDHAGQEQTGIMHRDVKPDNIMLVLEKEKDERLLNEKTIRKDRKILEHWLIDFGLAAEVRNTLQKHTNASADTRGTLPYMSPEQLRGKRHLWNGRTDQYSLAVVAYELLAGHLPFDADDDFTLRLAIKDEAPDPISGVPESVNAALLKGLAKSMEDRFATCAELVAVLSRTSGHIIVKPLPQEDKAPPQAPTQAPTHAVLRRDNFETLQEYEQRIADLPPIEIGYLKLNKEHYNHLQQQYVFLMDEIRWPLWKDFWGSIEFLRVSATEPEARELYAAGNRQLLTAKLCVREGKVVVDSLALGSRIVNPTKIQSGLGAGETRNDNGLGLVLVRCPKGQFALGQTSVTQTQYQKLMGADPSHFKGPNRPVEQVNWDEAKVFCQKFTEAERKAGRLPAGFVYDLPTEAQWEYAYRAGTTTAFSFGENEAELGRYCWFDQNSGKTTHDVKTREPNPWGMYDLHGNVWEWCADWYEEKLSGGRNPTGPSSGSYRVFRGGSCFSAASNCRSSTRYRYVQSFRRNYFGFRLCLSSTEPS